MTTDNAPIDTQALVEEKIVRMEAEISHHMIALSNLRARRNSFLPIFRLPSESLAVIFIEGARDYYESDDSGSLTHHIPAWVNVSYVCIHWRNVALDCQTLWTYHFNVSTRWTKEILRRSGQALLKVSCAFSDFQSENKDWHGLLDELLQHREQIQELRLRRPPLLSIKRFLGASCLEKLEIEDFWSNANLLVAADSAVSSLRTLKLFNCSLSWCSLNLGQLTTLDLHCIELPPRMEIDAVLAIFCGMQELTSLLLCSVLPGARQFLSDGGLDAFQKFDLPCLAFLSLAARTSAIVAFLSCINIPLKARLCLEPKSEDGSWRDYALISSFLAHQFNTAEQPLSPRPTFRSLIVDAKSTLQLTLSPSERDYNPLYPDVELGYDIPLVIKFQWTWYEMDESTITDICCSLPATNIQCLRVVVPQRASSRFWKKVLGHLHGLRRMKLTDGVVPDLSLLSLTSCDPQENPDRQPTQGPAMNHTFVPELEELALEHMYFGRDNDPAHPDHMSLRSFTDVVSTRKGLSVINRN